MVYKGLPSRACFHCRKRKLRCDLKRESCGQCLRANLECGGYRDPTQLRIRDESQLTKQRATNVKLKSLPSTIIIPIQERARIAFLYQYVCGCSNVYDVLETIPFDGPLTACIDAASLAFFSFQYGSEEAKSDSRQAYSNALPLLNKALQSPQTATTDSTFLGILLLDLFEKLNNTSTPTVASWMSHVSGAVALFNLRKVEDLQRYSALRLTIRLSFSLLISCLATNTPIPDALIQLRKTLEPYMNSENPKWRITGLNIKYANLRTAVFNQEILPLETIIRAIELDHEYVQITQSMPESWVYERKEVGDQDAGNKDGHLQNPKKMIHGVLENHYDIYSDYATTQTWNVLRLMRILLNDLIRLSCSAVPSSPSDSTTDPLPHTYTTATQTIDTLAKEICASAPQFTLPLTEKGNDKINLAMQRSQAYTLLVPLYIAAVSASPSTGIKEWVIKQMRFIVEELGIGNVKMVIDVLENGNNGNRNVTMGVWDVYAMLGCYAFAA